MVTLARHPATAVWALLMALTGVSWWLGAEHGVGDGATTAATLTVLAVAFVKVRFVGRYFMELREAPLPLRLIFDAWVVLVGGGVIGMYLIA